MSALPYLVLDTKRAVEGCQQGRAALKILERMLSLAADRKKKLIAEVRRAAGGKKARLRKELVELEKMRAVDFERKYAALLGPVRDAARQIAREISTERGGVPVFERSSLVVFDGDVEITEEVVRRLDSQT